MDLVLKVFCIGTARRSHHAVSTIAKKIKRDRLPSISTSADPSRLIGNYLTPACLDIPSLLRPVASTLLVPSNRAAVGDGTAVVVNHRGRRFIVTADHVVASRNNLAAVYQRYGKRTVMPLSKTELVFESDRAKGTKYEGYDIAVFRYDGAEVAGVDTIAPGLNELPAFLVGYPGKLRGIWDQDGIPLLSYGFATQRGQLAEAGRFFWQQPFEKPAVGQNSNSKLILFTGAAMSGNSGGGLFDIHGNLIGICQGPQVLLNGDKYESFYPIHELLEAL
ncbi:MAG: serine protease [Candidatus Margulisbacteria bacterium]|nr:serine protease [Candidatus Margulisiibacteriota bacterium]